MGIYGYRVSLSKEITGKSLCFTDGMGDGRRVVTKYTGNVKHRKQDWK